MSARRPDIAIAPAMPAMSNTAAAGTLSVTNGLDAHGDRDRGDHR
jgi:hypothetical protein